MITRDNYPEYSSIPEVDNINCFIDRDGYFAIEATFGGAEYVNLSYVDEYGEYLIEDPFLGTVFSSPDLDEAIDYFCQFYKLTLEDCQYIHSQGQSQDYISSATEPNTSDVFMLMEYTADIGPDTTGMDGDDFYCLGKFYASSLEDARSQFEAIKSQYPWIGKQSTKYRVTDYYVDEYNEYFDYQPSDEDDIDMNPSAMGGVKYNVFSDLETLISYLGWDKGPTEFGYDDEGLPFSFTEEEEYDFDDNPEEGNICRQALRDALIAIEVDPDYEDLASIIWDYNKANGTYDFEFFFDDGDSFKHSFDLNEVMPCDSVREASSIIEKSLHAALANSGKF